MSAASPSVAGTEEGLPRRLLGWFGRSLTRYTIQYLLLAAVIVIALTNE